MCDIVVLGHLVGSSCRPRVSSFCLGSCRPKCCIGTYPTPAPRTRLWGESMMEHGLCCPSDHLCLSWVVMLPGQTCQVPFCSVLSQSGSLTARKVEPGVCCRLEHWPWALHAHRHRGHSILRLLTSSWRLVLVVMQRGAGCQAEEREGSFSGCEQSPRGLQVS